MSAYFKFQLPLLTSHLKFMCNLERETHTTAHSSSVQKLRSQLTFTMAAVLELLIPVQAAVTTLCSTLWLPQLPVLQAE